MTPRSRRTRQRVVAPRRSRAAAAVPDRETQLLLRARRGDRAARAAVIESNLGLVRTVAARYHGMGMPFEDLVQEGAIGLLEAIDHFDPDRGSRFSTYAFWRVRQSMTHALSKQARLLRLPKSVLERRRAIAKAAATLAAAGRAPTAPALAEATGLTPTQVAEALAAPASVASLQAPLDEAMSLEAAVADGQAVDPEAAAVAEDERAALASALAELPARERAVVAAHFGLEGDPKSLAQVGAELHVSTARARAIEGKALYDLALELATTRPDPRR